MTALRLVIFDVDGTLVDSKAEIQAAMELAHETLGMNCPDAASIRAIVGLSLPEAFARLHPGATEKTAHRLSEEYRQAYFTLRTAPNAKEAPFFPGMRDLLDQLRREPSTLLAVATGKSRRGLDRLIAHHGLEGYFLSRQVSDDHPSKPNPSMIFAAMADCGVAPEDTVMIGDTSYDIEMARAAKVRSIAVGWGYHDPVTLAADTIAQSAVELQQILLRETEA